MATSAVIFISCGQVTEEEKDLGKDVCRLVKNLTQCEPYFAENQSSLNGVSEHIFKALGRSSGMIAIMHPRGEVLGLPGEKHTQASVWIEQEIAIASYLEQTEARDIPILAYIHRSIAREGLRDKLILNAQQFESNGEILAHLNSTLPAWKIAPLKHLPSINMTIGYERRLCDQDRHNYRLLIKLQNVGYEVVDNYHVDVIFPTGLLPKNQAHPLALHSTAQGTLFRVSTRDHQANVLYPNDLPDTVLTIDYYVDRNIFHNQTELLQSIVTATLYLPGRSPMSAKKNLSELQDF